MKLWGDAGRRGARACSSRICRIKTLKAAGRSRGLNQIGNAGHLDRKRLLSTHGLGVIVDRRSRQAALQLLDIGGDMEWLDSPLGVGYPGFWVVFCRSVFPRSAAVLSKSCVFSLLPIRKVLVLPFREGR